MFKRGNTVSTTILLLLFYHELKYFYIYLLPLPPRNQLVTYKLGDALCGTRDLSPPPRFIMYIHQKHNAHTTHTQRTHNTTHFNSNLSYTAGVGTLDFRSGSRTISSNTGNTRVQSSSTFLL